MGPPIPRQVKNIIYNVHSFFLRRKGDKECMEHKYNMNINKLVAEATGVSARTVMRIVAEGNSSLQTSEIAKFSSPRKTKEIKKRIQIDDFDMGVIRRKIHQFYTSDKKIPSIRKLLAVLKEDGIVNCGCTYLRQLLHKMGYLFKKCKSKRHILIERPSIAEWRVRYLRAIRKHRNENRNIYYLDETYVNSSHTSNMCWQSESEPGIYADIGKGRRLVIVHGGSRDGLVNGALTIFKSDSKCGDYHGDMNATNFHNWVSHKLKNKLAPNSVVVMDNASYHCVQVKKKPTMSSLKRDMQDWLRERNVEFTPDNTKSQSEKIYVIDEILKASGHIVLRLPPYHPDLNPIELVWADIKNNLATNYINTSLDDKIPIITKLFSEFTPGRWQKCDDHVQKIENQYWDHDMRFDNVIDELIINLGNDSDSEEDMEIEDMYSNEEEEEDMD
ncbi:unnamed protein product [Parnassius apollo]|uniref:(apollo) hypothetical protein n=1 Tax=Parnassius apollo TaxID=110799 RepID=A0A8S3W6C3_PARAO|nr:unnamed protein product [Parnassius apollo]